MFCVCTLQDEIVIADIKVREDQPLGRLKTMNGKFLVTNNNNLTKPNFSKRVNI